MSEDTNEAIETQLDGFGGYSRVTHDKLLAIRQLHKLGKQGKDIAAALEIHPSTVSRWLKVLDGGDDTVKEARYLAKSKALPATITITELIESPDPRVALGAAKAITALAGVQEGTAQVQVGVQVVVGSVNKPAGPDPFDVVESTS